MNIGIVSSEAVPFSKTGGLADVAGALFKVLTNIGETVYLFTPYYKKTKEQFKQIEKRIPFKIRIDGIDVEGFANLVEFYKNGFAVLIEQDHFFDRDNLYGEKGIDYPDNAIRFGFFDKAVLEIIKVLELKIDVLHLNDWQTGLIPMFVKDKGLPYKTLYTIHNLAYQGNFDKEVLRSLEIDDKYFSIDGLEFYGKVSFMKAGIVFADKISTVSPTYAKEILTEEFGERMEGILRTRKNDLVGILNGIDYEIWNPQNDPLIYRNFDVENINNKKDNKKRFVEEFGLKNANAPLFGMVSRIASQKGLDILSESLKEILNEDLNVVILGTGEKPLEEKLKTLSDLYPEKFKLFLTFDEALAHKIYASSDFFLMPSKYEPCGLGQMIALRYGTLPLVHEVGGLKDTVDNYSEITQCGNGFSFEEYSSDELTLTIKRALLIFKNESLLLKLIRIGMSCNFSWEQSAKKYLEIYKELRNAN
ncbi:MAG: glycogen synthase GlgA [Caldisericum sp.]|uniref:glycogen synthase GlgA n=1 Tax=Caldisericum sp. TaxID=2499687 RepID=UPI003D1272B0